MALSVWQRTIVTGAGDAIPAAEIEVFLAGTATAATLFQDAAGATPLTNPFNATAQGFAQFYVARGRYDIAASGGGSSITWSNVEIGGSLDVVWKTPYDYGAIPGQELSVDNSAYWNALMDAAEASWNSSNEGFAIMPDGGGKMWRVDTGTRLIDCQNPGMVIRDATLVVKGAGNIGLDLFGSNNVTVYNVTVVGDRTDPPDIGIAYGVNAANTVCPNIKLVNCRTRGKFNKFGRLRIGSEVSTEQSCQWMNWSRSLTAFSDGCVDNMQALVDHVGGVTSPNTTLRTTLQPPLSNTTHMMTNTVSFRQADFNLTVTGVTKANPAVVTYSTGILASAGLSNGDEIVFTKVPTGSMSELTTLGPFTVANINEGADTLELSGVDSTGWSGSFVQATCQNRTGPVSLYAGSTGFYRHFHYSLCYGNVHHVIDMATGQGIFDFEISALHERDPQSIVKFVPGSSDRVISGFRLRCLNYNQTVVDSVIDNSSGTAKLNFDNGYIHILNQEADPANGIWKDPSQIVIRENFDEIVQRGTSLNATSAFFAYSGRRYAGNSSRRFEDHSSADYYGDPRFVAAAALGRGLHAYLNDDGASSGPFIDAIRESASPATSDSIGGFRMVGKNAAGEDVIYTGVAGLILDATDGSEDGRLALQAMVAGTLTTIAYLQSAGLFINGNIAQTTRTTTTGALIVAGNAVNIVGKYEGLMLWNSTTGKPVWASGATAAAVWVNADGTTAHTPV